MNFTKIFLIAACIGAISCSWGDGCASCHTFVQRMNYAITNGNAIASVYYKSSHWMNNGQKNGSREAGSYTEAYNYMKSNNRPDQEESNALNLAALFTTYHQAKNRRMSHSCWKQPKDRAAIFSATNSSVGENVAWGSNVRDCKWAIYAWITDDGQTARGHRKNIYNKSFAQTGLSSDGYYYSQQSGSNITPKSTYNRDYPKFGIYKKYDCKKTGSYSWGN
jgi:uncharacterized protein YkwD